MQNYNITQTCCIDNLGIINRFFIIYKNIKMPNPKLISAVHLLRSKNQFLSSKNQNTPT